MNYRKMYAREFKEAQAALNTIPGEFAWSSHAYEAFTFKAPGLSLLFYPHKVSTTGNYHIRVRDNGSKNKNKFRAAVQLLQKDRTDVVFTCKAYKPGITA